MIHHDVLAGMCRQSVREFMESHKHFIKGNVLDFGAGKQPYRDIVESVGANYHPYDRRDFPGSVTVNDVGTGLSGQLWNTIICNQMLQYVPHPQKLLKDFENSLTLDGYLVMTYATNWNEIEKEDLWRFTKAGMEVMIERAGMNIESHVLRERTPELDWPIGYGIVASVR